MSYHKLFFEGHRRLGNTRFEAQAIMRATVFSFHIPDSMIMEAFVMPQNGHLYGPLLLMKIFRLMVLRGKYIEMRCG